MTLLGKRKEECIDKFYFATDKYNFLVACSKLFKKKSKKTHQETVKMMTYLLMTKFLLLFLKHKISSPTKRKLERFRMCRLKWVLNQYLQLVMMNRLKIIALWMIRKLIKRTRKIDLLNSIENKFLSK